MVPLQRGCGRTAPGAGREVTRRRWCGSERVGRRRAPGVAAEGSTPGLGTTGCVATGAAESGGAVASEAGRRGGGLHAVVGIRQDLWPQALRGWARRRPGPGGWL